MKEGQPKPQVRPEALKPRPETARIVFEAKRAVMHRADKIARRAV